MRYLQALAFIMLVVISVNSCERNDGNDRIDLINVVRDGATIPAYIYGNTNSKVFLIILHGGPGGNALEYRGGIYSDLLESDYAVVYTEQRSQGMAQGSFSEESMTVPNLAADVYGLNLALRSKYGEDVSIFLLGHSWGGMLGSQVMIDPLYQQAFKGWIDVDGAHDLPLTYKSAVRRIDEVAKEQILEVMDTIFWNNALETISEVDTSELVVDDFETVNALGYEGEAILQAAEILAPVDVDFALDALANSLFVNNLLTTFFSGNVANNTLYGNGLFEYSLSDELVNIEKPCLFLWGKYDMVVSSELAYDAFKRVGTSEKSIVIFERSGHSPMLQEGRFFAETIIDFIEEYR